MTKKSEAQVARNRPAALKRLFEFMEIPSVSTDGARAADCLDAAAWLIRDLAEIGFSAKAISTGSHPAIIAHGPKVANAPTVLFYGHYDVQPAEKEDGWDFEPFEPAIRELDGRQVIYGRGSADDKGQVMTFVEACRALADTDGIPINITLLIEGEEEIGSPSLAGVIEKYADELAADIALICDTEMLDRNTPAMAYSLRGFCGDIITVQGAKEDLHSGNYGGAASNPALALAGALASIKDDTGAIDLPGFYDGVPELPKQVKEDWARMSDIGASLLPDVGLGAPAGEADRSVLEQVWSRPSFDVNSLWSGYLGDGFKTVLPATAHCKISFRLVGDQDPHKIRKAFRAAIEANLPEDCTASFEAFGSVNATQMDVSRPEFSIAKDAIKDLWPNESVLIGMGGSIPAVGTLKTVLGVDSLLLGFGQADDRIHGPNEKLDLESFDKGTIAWLRFIEAYADHSSSKTKAETARSGSQKDTAKDYALA